MRYSIYNIVIPSINKTFIYNSKSDYFVQILPELAELYQSCENNIKLLEDKAPDFYNHLVEKGLIVEDNPNELQEIINKWQEEENNSNVLQITINPTLNCNLRCWYCYEEHNAHTLMSQDTCHAITAYIKKSVLQKGYKQINLSFFGGEPLLHFNDITKPLIDDISTALSPETKLSLHFTTNSTLLNDTIIDYLIPFSPSFQITIDGNEFIHNMVKAIANRSAYKIALTNIQKLLTKKLKVGIRFNYTVKTLQTFIDVLSDIKGFSDEEKSYCNISFHRIWQDNKVPDSELEKQLSELESQFRKEGFYVISNSSNITGRCYADKLNSIVINYDGRVYMCTARDFNAENSEGTLNPNGTIKRNDRFKKRMAIRYGNAYCQSCIVFPICHGGCSQHKLESKVTDGCYKNFNEQDKIAFATKRIQDIYNEHTVTTSN